MRVNYKSIIIIVAVSAANLGLRWAGKRGYFTDDSIQTIMQQLSFLLLGQTHKAVRPERAEDSQ